MTSTSGIKIFAYIIDVVCALLALVLISSGIYVIVSYDANDIGQFSAYAYIAIGVAALLVFLWGYLAAWRENVCCTVTFVVVLYIVIIAQLVVSFLLTRGTAAVASNLANSLDTAWNEELDSPGAMSLYENWFECCGRASPQDYIVNERLPPSTCFRNNDSSKAENLITKGCRVEFENYWLHLLLVFNILCWILIGLEIIGSIVSCCLCNSIRNDRRRTYF